MALKVLMRYPSQRCGNNTNLIGNYYDQISTQGQMGSNVNGPSISNRQVVGSSEWITKQISPQNLFNNQINGSNNL